LKAHPFYTAFKYGFVQSYSTSLVLKDFDAVSGLQNNIDEIIDNLTTDKEGNPNEIHKAIKWWQGFGADQGFGVDSLVMAASKLSVLNGTTLSKEMVNLSGRLKSKKDMESVSRYVGDLIGGPASEAVIIGGSVMVSFDVISKYVLATSLETRTNPKTKKPYTTEEAYSEANRTFIDYRRNMPSEIKALSDYGVLLFPSFWMKAQKVIWNLAHYHPATAIGGYAIADALDVNSANFMDVNVINRMLDGKIVNEPTNLIDWDMLFWWM